jgi:hypothetical protein
MASLRLLVLNFVRGYIGHWNDSPSYGEIAEALGTNRERIRQAVRSLVEDELLLRTPGPRGLALPSDRDHAIRVLHALGYTVFPSGQILPMPPLTNPTLPMIPMLDYLPTRDSGGENGEGRTAKERDDGGRGGNRRAAGARR